MQTDKIKLQSIADEIFPGDPLRCSTPVSNDEIESRKQKEVLNCAGELGKKLVIKNWQLFETNEQLNGVIEEQSKTEAKLRIENSLKDEHLQNLIVHNDSLVDELKNSITVRDNTIETLSDQVLILEKKLERSLSNAETLTSCLENQHTQFENINKDYLSMIDENNRIKQYMNTLNEIIPERPIHLRSGIMVNCEILGSYLIEMSKSNNESIIHLEEKILSRNNTIETLLKSNTAVKNENELYQNSNEILTNQLSESSMKLEEFKNSIEKLIIERDLLNESAIKEDIGIADQMNKQTVFQETLEFNHIANVPNVTQYTSTEDLVEINSTVTTTTSNDYCHRCSGVSQENVSTSMNNEEDTGINLQGRLEINKDVSTCMGDLVNIPEMVDEYIDNPYDDFNENTEINVSTQTSLVTKDGSVQMEYGIFTKEGAVQTECEVITKDGSVQMEYGIFTKEGAVQTECEVITKEGEVQTDLVTTPTKEGITQTVHIDNSGDKQMQTELECSEYSTQTEIVETPEMTCGYTQTCASIEQPTTTKPEVTSTVCQTVIHTSEKCLQSEKLDAEEISTQTTREARNTIDIPTQTVIISEDKITETTPKPALLNISTQASTENTTAGIVLSDSLTQTFVIESSELSTQTSPVIQDHSYSQTIPSAETVGYTENIGNDEIASKYSVNTSRMSDYYGEDTSKRCKTTDMQSDNSISNNIIKTNTTIKELNKTIFWVIFNIQAMVNVINKKWNNGAKPAKLKMGYISPAMVENIVNEFKDLIEKRLNYINPYYDPNNIKNLVITFKYELKVRDTTIEKQTLEMNNLYDKLKSTIEDKCDSAHNNELSKLQLKLEKEHTKTLIKELNTITKTIPRNQLLLEYKESIEMKESLIVRCNKLEIELLIKNSENKKKHTEILIVKRKLLELQELYKKSQDFNVKLQEEQVRFTENSTISPCVTFTRHALT